MECEAFVFFFFRVLQDKRKDAVKKVIAAMTVGKDVSSLFTDVVNCMQTENLELKKLVYLYLINYAKSQPDLAILAVNTFVKVKTEITAISSCFVVYYLFCYPSLLFISWHFGVSWLYVPARPTIVIPIFYYPTFWNSSQIHIQCCWGCWFTQEMSIWKDSLLLYCNICSLESDSFFSPVIYKYWQDSQDPNPLIRALAVRTMGCIRVDKITEYLCDPLQRCLKVGTQHSYNLYIYVYIYIYIYIYIVIF